MTARKGIGTRCFATASTVAALLAGSAFGGAGSIELDALGALSMAEDDLTIRAAVMAEKYGDRPLCFVSDSNLQSFSDGLLPVNVSAEKPTRKILEGTIGVKPSGESAAALSGDFVSAEEMELTGGIGIVATFPAEFWSGAEWRTDGGLAGILPGTFSRSAPLSCKGRRVEFARKDGKKVVFEFSEEAGIFAFDDRRQRGIGLSLGMMTRPGTVLPAGASVKFSCKVVREGGLNVRCATIEEAVPGEEWIPIVNSLDIEKGSALDFSGMGFLDAPAGKHGWLKAVGGHFEFERRPGVAQRFYGVNLVLDAVCPEKRVTDALVTRLARLGYNTIRIHQQEKATLRKNGRVGIVFDDDALDRMDYLIAKATEAGIYVTTDLFVTRPVAWKAVGENREGFMTSYEYKSLLVLGHPGAMEDWKRYTRAWLGHVNPYTGRTLANEPALITLGLVNEGHLGMAWHFVKDMPVAQEKWERWLKSGRAAEFGIDTSAVPKRVNAIGAFRDASSAFALFAADLEREKIEAMRKTVRELGYRGLVFNDNNGPKYAARQLVRDDTYDIVDVHFYIDHPSFLGVNWTAPYSLEGANPFFAKRYMIATVCSERLYGKPFTVTEWQHASAALYRSTAGLLVGTVAAGQDWSALWRFAYAHGAKALETEGARVDSFDLSGDPVKQATDRTFALLYLRGDMPVFKDRMTFGVTKRSINPESGRALCIDLPGWSRRAMFESQIGSTVALDGSLPDGAVPIEDAVASSERPKRRHAAKSPLKVNESTGAFSLVTPRTCGGFSEAGGKVSAGPLAFAVSGYMATVSASSIDGRPLESSSRILVTHLTDASGEGARFANGRHTMILDYGRPGTALLRAGTAKIALALSGLEASGGTPPYRVYALDTSGRRDAEVPTVVRKGRLMFTAEVKPGSAHLYYEVVRR